MRPHLVSHLVSRYECTSELPTATGSLLSIDVIDFSRSAIGIIMRPSVCNAVHCGSHGRYTGLKVLRYKRVPDRQIPICLFRHFCCMMYRLATKTDRKRVEENASVVT